MPLARRHRSCWNLATSQCSDYKHKEQNSAEQSYKHKEKNSAEKKYKHKEQNSAEQETKITVVNVNTWP